MQLAPAAVYFILPADGVIPPAVLLHLLTDGSTVFQISPVETNKYHFLSREMHLLLINSMQLVEVVDNGHNGKLDPPFNSKKFPPPTYQSTADPGVRKA